MLIPPYLYDKCSSQPTRFQGPGERLPKNRIAPHDSFYCVKCGGEVGKTEDDVIKNGLRCSYHPEEANHPFGIPYSPFPGA